MATDPNDQLAFVRRLKADKAELADELNRLKGGGGGGTSDGMVPLKEYVDKADEAVETRLNARFDRLATKETVWGAAVTVLGILFAVLAFASDRFDGGLSVQSALEPALTQMRHEASQQRVEQARRDLQQDRKLDEILSRLPPKQVPQPPR